MKKRFSLLLLGLFLSIGMALAQKQISGVVTSSQDGEPIIGATVKVVGTKIGVVTDINGHFSLSAPANSKLEFSYVGMQSKQVVGKEDMHVTLDTEEKFLQEVVVTGYGSAKKIGSIVGSVAVVTGERLDKAVTPNFTDALAGQVSGLSVLSSAGDPSTQAAIRLRGIGSINASVQPLFILDGAPISSTMFNTLNPADIESITVLKDAASTAIYGSRAANGVIVITSRKGKYGERANLTLRGQYGISSPVEDGAEMMNSQQYIQFRDLMGQPVSDEVRNLVNKYGFDTNWRDELLNFAAPTYTLDATLSGGGETMSYYLSYNYHNQEGIIEQSGMHRQVLRAEIDARVNPWLKMGVTTNFGSNDYSVNNSWASSGGVYLNNPLVALRMALPYDTPNYYTFDDNGNIVWGDRAAHLKYSDITMPWWTISHQVVARKRITMNSSVYEQANPIKGLTLRAQQSVELFTTTLEAEGLPQDQFTTPMGDVMEKSDGWAQDQYDRYYRYTFTNTAEYSRNFGRHGLTLLLGHEAIISRSKAFQVETQGQSDPRQMRLSDGTSVSISNIADARVERIMMSYFGSLDYNWAEKYYLQGSIRRDASSQFAPAHRWGTFYSFGASWNLKGENFLKQTSWINNLRLKASYGEVGNNGIGDYGYLGTLDTGGIYHGSNSIDISNPSNSELTWEKTSELDLGLSTRLFNRVSFNFDWYRKKTSDMLMSIPYSYTTGFSGGAGNIGAMVNKGFDADVAVDIIQQKDLMWTVKANVNYNRNEITELFGGRDSYTITGTGITLQVGKPYGEYEMVRYAGVDSRTGEAQWYDKAGNITKLYNEEEMMVFTGKQRYAPWSGGAGSNLVWKNLSVNVDFQWALGKWMTNNDNFFIENAMMGTSYNQTTNMLNIWTTPGQVTDVPANGFSVFDDHLLQNASFFRMKNLTIQYTLPQSWIKHCGGCLKQAKIFGIARNLFTITKFKGYDPEPDANIVQFNYPNTRQFVFGLEVTL